VLQLTRLSGPVFALNPDLIERAEATPDTVVTLVNGSKYVIRESLDELIDLIHAYRVGLVAAAQANGLGPSNGYARTSPVHPSGAAPAQPLPRPAMARAESAGNVVTLHPGGDD
jgi:flagellar protein FlbD